MSSESDNRREFAHSNNPRFDCAPSLLLIPFGRESYLRLAVEILGGRRIPLDESTDRIVYQLGGTARPVTLLYSGMGGPAVANALEMAHANGARRVVIVGACGGVDAAVGIGDLVVVAAAVRGEGTSRYYAPPEFPAACDPRTTLRLWQLASAASGTVHCGVTYTTDASYRQGAEIYEAPGRLLAAESECATAAVVSYSLGLAMGAVLFCSDSVRAAREEDRRYRGLAEPRIEAGFRTALDTAVTALGDLSDDRDM